MGDRLLGNGRQLGGEEVTEGGGDENRAAPQRTGTRSPSSA
ncbi:hypothetical protein [Streptomyces hydrogenans]